MTEVYIHNSGHKEHIRDKWVEFASEMIDDSGLKVITFPAEEMHDLRLFAERGLINWEETETGSFYVTKGKVVCFEKLSKYYVALTNKLSNATVEQYEIGAYLRANYKKIMEGNTKIFPVDAVNLDFDGNLSKQKVPIDEVINLVCEYQALHNKSFSLFITWPQTEAEDEAAYIALLKQTIGNNLDDPRATSFKELYEANYPDIEELNYDQLSIIGLSKIIIQKSSHHKYNLHKNEFYVYGEPDRRPMFSLLFNFDYQGEIAEHIHYANGVSKSLVDVNDLRNNVAKAVGD